MARIDSAYDYYLSTYGAQETSRYDAHKKSDLRKVYNHIVKTNKESPLYKISDLESAKKFAIDIKETAKSIQNVVSSLSDSNGSFEDSFQKRVAVSSDDDTVGVTYIGNGIDEGSESFEIQVLKLAKPQINQGNYLNKDGLSFTPGTYSFDLNTPANAYEFQFSVSSGETNFDILNKLSKLINQSSLGLSSELREADDSVALRLTSTQTGLSEKENYLFEIQPGTDNESIRAMNLLGIHNVEETASNSLFLLNGEGRSSLSNTFTINNTFELTMKVAETDPVTIGFKGNIEAVTDNVKTLVSVFNRMIDKASEYAVAGGGNRLLNDLSSITKNQEESLTALGLVHDEFGRLQLDEERLTDALAPERANETFETLSNFKDAIGEKANNASINPMGYVNKIVVAYKNPGHNFNTPYISSIYAGMMLDSIV